MRFGTVKHGKWIERVGKFIVENEYEYDSLKSTIFGGFKCAFVDNMRKGHWVELSNESIEAGVLYNG